MSEPTASYAALGTVLAAIALGVAVLNWISHPKRRHLKWKQWRELFK